MEALLTKLRILGKSYNLYRADAGAFGESHLGRINVPKGQIYVSQEQTPDSERETILHECLHALDFDLKFELSEAQVHGIAAVIYCLLRDNPWLLKMLSENEVPDMMNIPREVPQHAYIENLEVRLKASLEQYEALAKQHSELLTAVDDLEKATR